MSNRLPIKKYEAITLQNVVFKEPTIFYTVVDELKEIKGLGVFLSYNGVPKHLQDKPISIPFTFSKQYEFLLDELHLITEFEKDLNKIGMKNEAMGVVVSNIIARYNPYVSSVRASLQLILDN